MSIYITNQKLQKTLGRMGTGILTALLLGAIAFLGARSYQYLPAVASRVYSAAITLTSVFHGANTLSLKSDKLSLSSGESFVLTFTNTDKNEGTYSLTYTCTDGLALSTANTKIACDVPFSILTTKNEIPLKVTSLQTRFANLPITVSFTEKGDTSANLSADILLLVNNTNIDAETFEIKNLSTPIVSAPTTPAVPTTPKPTTPVVGPKQENVYPVAVSAPTQTGSADLVATIIEIGVIDKATNTFVPTTDLKSTDRVAVHFSIANKGGKASGSWYFNAVLPTYPSYIFTSDGQQSLNPGDRIEFTIGFDRIEKTDGNIVVINVDPANSINESNKDNNIVKTTISGVKF